ncbi:ATP-binding protein [uncultured Gimesia sp.]|uniref:ATP-binding protein n=1 Tax=uncultured Gimesia sp. TaxID=1678688 RepID=UPI0030DD5A1D|tara:strand:+ start:36193 stop:37884 length:1692 start_codon:yes stop_codon:yes gene_type:complete
MTSDRVRLNDNQIAGQILKFSRDVSVAIDETGSILMSSASIEHAFGWQAEEVIGEELCFLLSDPYLNSCEQYLAECSNLANLEGQTRQIIAKRKDGSCFPCELTISRVDDIQNQILYIGIIRDISERLKTQNKQNEYLERLKQSRRELKRKDYELKAARKVVERANQAKSEFLANMSHEIRTPMTAILGYAEILKENPGSPDNFELIEIIQNNGTHLLQVINDILDISKIEMGDFEIQKVNCCPKQVLQEVVDAYQLKAAEKGLPIHTQCQDSVPELIKTDPVRLRQVLWNLVSNAVKFTESGRIEIELRVFSQSKNDRVLQFTVADTGVGIPAEKVNHIFEPFAQADSSTSRNYGGTGLGLTLSYKLVQLLGGNLSVQSTLDQGSVFCVALNVGESVQSTLNNKQRHRFSLGNSVKQDRHQQKIKTERDEYKGKVLLVDDTKEIRKLFSYMLNKMGLEVVTALNGKEAVDQMNDVANQHAPYDMILMDMQMPVMNGYEATQLLRSQGNQIPIIAITAHALVSDREKCLAAGCTEYLSKPIKYEVLHEMVNCYLPETAAMFSN